MWPRSPLSIRPFRADAEHEVIVLHSEEGTRLDATELRAALGCFATGVTAVCATADDGAPAGFACQSFVSLSLEPPLVLFCPAKTSRTWPVIERAGRFSVNVLASSQRGVSRLFGSDRDRFGAVSWRPGPAGSPVLDGAVTWIECAVADVHDGGDHHIVTGRVTALGECRDERPLLFYRGVYTAVEERDRASAGLGTP